MSFTGPTSVGEGDGLLSHAELFFSSGGKGTPSITAKCKVEEIVFHK